MEPEKEPEVPAGQKLRRHGYRWRTVRSVSIGLKPVVLKVKVPRWLNTTIGRGIRAEPPFVEAYTKITRLLARLIVDLARFMTLADIAGWRSSSWETVRTVVQRRLERDYRRIGYRRVHAIAIDELYLGRARKYITLVIDLESARIIWARPRKPGAAGVLAPL